MKLRDAITGKSEDVLGDVKQALDNRARVNTRSDDGTSNLALAFRSEHPEPVREDTICMLLGHGAKFTNDVEECYIYRRYASELSPFLLQDLVFSGCFESVDSGMVLSEMRWVIIGEKPHAVEKMREFIYQAKVIFHELKGKKKLHDLKEKNKTDDDGDDSGDDSEDEDEEYMDLDDFLSKMMQGNTLLHLVIEYRLRTTDCLSLLRLLIDCGAQLSAKDEDGHTPRELALILIGSSGDRKYAKVITMLETEEALQEAETREFDRQKHEAIAMTINQRVGQTSMFKDIDPAVIRMILEILRKKTAIHTV